jgi:hypothetical protein
MAQSDGNLNVRTDGLRPSVQNKKITGQTQNTQKHRKPWGSHIWRNWNFHEFLSKWRWHNLMEISMYGRTDFVRTDKKQTNTDKQTHKKPWGNTSEGIEISIRQFNGKEFCHEFIQWQKICLQTYSMAKKCALRFPTSVRCWLKKLKKNKKKMTDWLHSITDGRTSITYIALHCIYIALAIELHYIVLPVHCITLHYIWLSNNVNGTACLLLNCASVTLISICVNGHCALLDWWARL